MIQGRETNVENLSFLWFKIHEQPRAVCLSLHRLKLSQWRGRTDDVCVGGEWEGKECSSVSRSWSRQQKMIILMHSSSLSHLPWWKNNRDPFHVYCITLQSLQSVFTFIILFDPHANPKREPWWILFFPFSRWENMGLKGDKWLFHWKTIQISSRTRTHAFVSQNSVLSIVSTQPRMFSNLPILEV